MAAKMIIAGLIGAGRMGMLHGENMVLNLPNVLLKAVAEHNLDEEWVRGLGIAVHSRDAETVLTDPEIEAVVIATSSASHVALIKTAARAGKQIFCEKPIAFKPQALREALDAVEAAGVLLQVGFNRRFDPNFTRVRELVGSGKIGLPYIIKITNRDPVRPRLDYVVKSGGLIMDFCIHDFDMVRFISGSEVDTVYAAGAVLIDPALQELGDIDTALITMTLTSGALAVIDVSRETHYGYDQRLEILGSLGCVSAPNTTPTRTTLSTAEGVFTDNPFASYAERYRVAYINELAEFFSCIRNGTDPSVGGEDALAAVNIARAASDSHRQNMPVSMVT